MLNIAVVVTVQKLLSRARGSAWIERDTEDQEVPVQTLTGCAIVNSRHWFCRTKGCYLE